MGPDTPETPRATVAPALVLQTGADAATKGKGPNEVASDSLTTADDGG
eukprot:CAMPEP_0118861998 /NCGR_PEP_ID=MMETSP1163-20130328/7347_1 /TAXON_ID=124430 /ORGANISM="Phaeomonas parva, Strain CCMP2877" /LENGTH=47 /DNA_ID= /DNA_START= /DNA_END= /DNA_ORIENTATION=